MPIEIEAGKLSAEKKKKLSKKELKKFKEIKKQLAERGIDAEIGEIKKVKKKTDEHNVKLNDNLKEAIDTVLDGAEKSLLKEKGADRITHIYDEYEKSAPYVSVIWKMEKDGPKGQEKTVEKIGIKKGDEIFDVDPIRRFFVKALINQAEEIYIRQEKKK